MSFYSDFIEEVDQTVDGVRAIVERGHHDFPDTYLREVRTFAAVAEVMRAAKIIHLNAAQAEVFLEIPRVEGQNYFQWLRLPFPQTYVHLEGAIRFKGYRGELDDDSIEPMVRGVLLSEIEGAKVLTIESWDDKGTSEERRLAADDRILQAQFLMPLPDHPLNIHTATVILHSDGTLEMSRIGLRETRERMFTWTIHLLNFLDSPSVKLVTRTHPEALQKARARRGRNPLPGWYEITYRKHTGEYSKEKVSGQGWQHSFRYDVRGHFAHFTRGRLAGRVLWIPAHQRGIRHTLYKPKVYRADRKESN